MRIAARFESVSLFDEYQSAVEVSLNAALVKGADVAKREILYAINRHDNDPRGPGPHFAKPNEAGRYHLDDPAGWHVAVQRIRAIGIGAFVVWTDNVNALFQNYGTRGRRQKSLKRGGSPHTRGAVTSNLNVTDGHPGTTPEYFLQTGLREAYPLVLALVQEALTLGGGRFGGVPSRTFGTTPDDFHSGGGYTS